MASTFDLSAMMPDADRPEGCNCPPLEDVFSGTVTTKDPCPVHPEPPNLGDFIKPRITEGCFGPYISFRPIR